MSYRRDCQQYQALSLNVAATEARFVDDLVQARRLREGQQISAAMNGHHLQPRAIRGPRLLTPASLHLTHSTFHGIEVLCTNPDCTPLREFGLPAGARYDPKFRIEFTPSDTLGAVHGPGVSLAGVLTVGPQCIDNPYEEPLLTQPLGSIKYFLQIDGNDAIPSYVSHELHIPGNCEHRPLTRFDIAAWIAVAVAARSSVQDVRTLRANLLEFEYVGRQMWRAVVRTA